MQNKKWLTAMAIGLGVLAGAAQAVPMKMTIDGHLAHTGSFDLGQESFWNSGQFLSNLPIQITIRFNSDSLASSPAGTTAYHGSGPAFSADIVLNGIQHSITSNSSWNLSKGGEKSINLNIGEAIVKDAGGTIRGNSLSGTLSFSDESLPILNNMRLGHTPTTTLQGTNGLTFSYVTGDPANWNTRTNLNIVPTSANIAPVPEPETWAMMAAGLGLVGFAARRRSR